MFGQQQEDVTKILNKEEQRIFKGLTKMTPSAYSLYVKDMFRKINANHDPPKTVFTQIALNWKKLDPKKRKTYVDAAALVSSPSSNFMKEFIAKMKQLIATKLKFALFAVYLIS